VRNIGIYGLLGGKLAAYHDQGISYTLYLTTFALDSVGDLFGFVLFLVFVLASSIVILRRGEPVAITG
jgi:hypothetical protein